MRSLLCCVSLLSFAPALAAQAPSDSAKIVAAARDYIDGFGAGDTARVRRSVHPDVAERLVNGRDAAPSNQTADMGVGITARMRADPDAPTAPADSVTIIAHERDMAMVRIGAGMWVDYLQLGRFGDRWHIVNVLWQLRSR